MDSGRYNFSESSNDFISEETNRLYWTLSGIVAIAAAVIAVLETVLRKRRLNGE